MTWEERPELTFRLGPEEEESATGRAFQAEGTA